MFTHRMLSSVVHRACPKSLWRGLAACWQTGGLRLFGWALVALVLTGAAAQAQGTRQPQRLPTFRQRMGNLRDSFFGSRNRDDEPQDEPLPNETSPQSPPAPRMGSVDRSHGNAWTDRTDDEDSTNPQAFNAPGRHYSSRRTAQPDYRAETMDSETSPPSSDSDELPPEETSSSATAKPDKRAGAASKDELPPEADSSSTEETASEENDSGVRQAEHRSPTLDELLARVRARRAAGSSQGSESSETIEPAERQKSKPVAKKVERVAQQPFRRPVTESAEEPEVIRTEEHSAVLSAPADNVLVTRKSPELRVETSGPRRITVGKESVYKVLVHNAADVAAQGITLTIEAPEWAKITGTQASTGEVRKLSGDNTAQCQWRIAKIEGRNHAELTLRLVAAKSQSFDLAVQWTSSPLTAQAVVEVEEPKLAMTISGPKEVAFGEKALYKLTFSNPGTADTEHVVVRLLPIGSGSDAIDTHEIGKLAAGSSRTVEIELVARQTGRLNIKAQATADGGLESSASQEVLVRRAALEVKVEGPKFQYAGTAATFRVHIKNTGNEPARNVQLTTILPHESTYESCDHDGQYDAETSRVTWSLKDLAPDAEETITVKGVLTAGGSNEFSASCDADGDLHSSGSCATEVEALADLVLRVNDPQGPVEVGADVVYEVIVKNRGSKSAEGVDVVAFFSEGVEPVAVDSGKYEISPGKVIFGQLLAVAADEEVVFRITARASSPGNHVCRAEVHCTTPETSLAVEETTKFFGEAAASAESEPAPAAESAEAEPAPAAAAEPEPAELQPVPAPKPAKSASKSKKTVTR